jgi:hypothetical protein
MDLFSNAQCKINVDDTLEMLSGFDMRDPFTRVRVHEIVAGSALVAPWMVTGKHEISKHGKWISLAMLEAQYRRMGETDAT